MSAGSAKNWCIFFKAVHDQHRQRILELLKTHRQLNASYIVKQLRLSQPTVSHHLKILYQAHLIYADKQGKEVVYSINEDSIIKCCGGFIDRFTHKNQSK